MAVSQRLRYEVLRRDNHCCRYCGAAAPDVQLTVDHVVPVALGGSDDPTNLVTACRPCNSGKAASAPDSPLVADVAADALRWGKAMQIAAEIRQVELDVLHAYVKRIDGIWSAWQVKDKPIPRPLDWPCTAEIFYGLRLPIDEWEYAIDRAMRNSRVSHDQIWKYMCGILWKRQHEQTAVAQSIIAEAEAGDPWPGL